MKKLLLCVTGLLLANLGYSQNRGIIVGDTGILISKNRIELSDARRIPTEPRIELPEIIAPELSYSLSLKSQQVPALIVLPSAEKMQKERTVTHHHNYIKLGYGNNLSALADVYITMPGKSGLLAFSFNHLSGNGPGLTDFNRNNGLIFGEKYFKKGKLEADFHYKRRGQYLYGYNPETFIPSNNDTLRQVFQEIGGKLNWSSKKTGRKQPLYSFGADYYNFTDRWNQSENRVNVNGFYQLNLKANMLTIDGGYGFQQFKNDSSGFTRHFVDIRPYYTIQKDDWELNLGFVSTIISELDKDPLFKFFPRIDGVYQIQKNQLSVFGGISGSVEKNNFRDFANLNPFLSYDPNIEVSVNQFIFDAGIKGKLSGNTGFVTKINYRRVNNAPLFVLDSTDFRTFRIIQEDMEVVKVTAEITHQYSEKFRAALRFNYNHYEPQVQSFAWQLPRYDANLNLTYNLGDKILLTFDGFVYGERKVLIFSNQTERIQTIKPLGDFNLGIDYRYKKQISAFLKLNNLMGQHYQIWYAHPMYSFNFHAGVAIGF